MEASPDRGKRRGVVIAAVTVAAVGAVAVGGLALRGRGQWVLGLLAHSGANVRAAHATPHHVTIGVGSVNNNSGAGGPELSVAATEAMRVALAQRPEVSLNGAGAPAERGARQSAQGHFFDANIQALRPVGNGTRATVSLVVSTYPGRVYEFESTSSVTLSGGSSAGTQAQTDAVRSAMHSAVNRALDQLLPGT